MPRTDTHTTSEADAEAFQRAHDEDDHEPPDELDLTEADLERHRRRMRALEQAQRGAGVE